MPLPDSIVHQVHRPRASAARPNRRYGVFARDSWLSVLVGRGIIPTGYDRLGDAFALPTVVDRMTELRSRIQTNVDAMSSHGAFIADYCQSAEVAASKEATP